ncbi:TPA: minor capsid protein [Clostridioides difficile]|nr:minor capsid protein [Clostridioides difficile]HBH1823445.1 minor capsid protein [Clostridioides difficile]
MNNNIEYWEEREKQRLNARLKDEKEVLKELDKQYKIAMKNIEKEIANLFYKYAKQNKLTYAETQKNLTNNEFKVWRMDIKQYIKLIEQTNDERLLLELNTLAMKSRINRLEELFYQISKEIYNTFDIQNNRVEKLLEESVKDSYYKSIYETQKFVGVGTSFSKLDKETLKDIITYPWSGKNFSQRIWKNRDLLSEVIKEEITQMVIRGESLKKIANRVSEKMDSSYENAIRLVQTEHSHFMSEADKKAYESQGVDKYQFLATLQDNTCKRCRNIDMKVYLVKDAKEGENYPPMHPRCRCTTIPYFPHKEGETRTARLPKGKTYEVPSNLSYNEWYKKHVEVAINREKENKNNVIINNIRKDIKDGKYNLNIHNGKQGKHFKDHNNYTEGRSYLTVSKEEAQKLINKYAGTGILELDRNGKFKNKELITCEKNIGVNISNLTGKETTTNKFYIHYSKNGTHIVPTMKGVEKDE